MPYGDTADEGIVEAGMRVPGGVTERFGVEKLGVSGISTLNSGGL